MLLLHDAVTYSWVFLAGQEWCRVTFELKFEFFSFNNLGVPQIFWQRVVQPRPKYSYCIFLKGLCWVSVRWILNNALCSMSSMFSGFYCVPNCAINIWHHMLCYLPNIYNSMKFTASRREYNLSSCNFSQ